MRAIAIAVVVCGFAAHADPPAVELDRHDEPQQRARFDLEVGSGFVVLDEDGQAQASTSLGWYPLRGRSWRLGIELQVSQLHHEPVAAAPAVMLVFKQRF